MDKAEYKRLTGTKPDQDDLERVNCSKAGEIGHRQCGWCGNHKLPRFQCGCVLVGGSVHSRNKNEQSF